MEIIIYGMVLGVIPGLVAKYVKNRSFGWWWLFGALLFIIALPAACLVRPVAGGRMRQCPHCRELVLADASVCKHCHSRLDTHA